MTYREGKRFIHIPPPCIFVSKSAAFIPSCPHFQRTVQPSYILDVPFPLPGFVQVKLYPVLYDGCHILGALLSVKVSRCFLQNDD